MGVNYKGGMIVGELGDKLSCPDDYDSFYEWALEMKMDRMSQHYDADCDQCYYGFKVDNVSIADLDIWCRDVREKARLFEKLTGVQARLIGTQNIT